MVFGNEQEEFSPEEKIAEGHSERVFKELKKGMDYLKGALKGLKKAIGLDKKITYEEVMKYFIAHKDDSPAIVKGALLKEATANGTLITQVFLDKDNNIVTGKLGEPIGYKKEVMQVDDELLHLFNDVDLIIVE